MHSESTRIIVTVIGHDEVGIIAAVSTVLAEAHVNIIDISQTTLRGYFAMVMMADTQHANIPFEDIKQRLNKKGEDIGLRIEAQHEAVFDYMHRI